VAEVLRAAGHQAYLAGGCVRDALLGVEPKDYDITTDATPEQVARLFRRTILVGAAFGVVKVVLGKDRDYEVATFRTDGTYTDGRRPDAVAYAKTAEEDVLRRDFTLNALLMDPRDDSILDFVGGRQDLEAGLIRAVGVPEARFQEDRLRMLRAVRFAARFGFGIEAETRAAIHHQAAALTDVSVERISAELEGILKSERPGLGFELLAETGLLVPALPHLAGQAPEARARMQAALTRLPEAARALGPDDRVIVAWALTLEGRGPDEVDAALRSMKLSREQLRGVKALLLAQGELTSMDDPKGAAAVGLLARPDAPLALAYQAALLGADHPAVARARAVQADLLEHPLPPRPLVTGADLQGLGLRPGPHFKGLMDAVDVEVLERRIHDKAEALAFVQARLGATGE